MKNTFSTQQIKMFVALGVLGVNVLFLVWYIFYGYQYPFHSDSAAKVLIAQETIETGAYFPEDWNYVNGDLFVVFGNAFVMPFLYFFSPGFTVHAISGLISAALILSGVWFVSGITNASTLKRVVIVAIFAAGFSGFTAENLYGQVSYGAIFYMACYMVYFTWMFLNADGRVKFIFGILLSILFTFAFWANPQRALISFFMPLFLAISYYTFIGGKGVRNIGVMAFVFVLLGAVMGGVLHAGTIERVNNVQGASTALWLSYDLMLHNASYLLGQFITIFGSLPQSGRSVITLVGVIEVVSMLSALALLVLMILSIKRSMNLALTGLAFLTIFSITSFMFVLFFQLTTTIPDMNGPFQSSRYLICSLLFLGIIGLSIKYNISENPVLALASILVSLVLISGAYTVYVTSDSGSKIALEWGRSIERENKSAKLLEFLVNNKLKYGYATYWNAGRLSVLSDNEVRVRQITINHSMPIPMRHLSSDRWYRPEAWDGKTFLLLTVQEAALVDWEHLAVYLDRPSQELVFEDFRVFVFENNISNNLPHWDAEFKNAFTFPASRYSQRTIGRFEENYVGVGPALIAEKEEVGALYFGPYVDVEKGEYKIVFELSVEESLHGAVKIDMVSSGGEIIHDEKDFDLDNLLELDVDLVEAAGAVEFRVWALGSQQVVFKGVSIERKDVN